MMRKKPMLAYPVSTKPIDYNEPVFIIDIAISNPNPSGYPSLNL